MNNTSNKLGRRKYEHHKTDNIYRWKLPNDRLHRETCDQLAMSNIAAKYAKDRSL